MKNIILFFFLFVNSSCQEEKNCSLYLAHSENETYIEEIYFCDNILFMKFKYSEIRDVKFKELKKGYYQLINIENSINQNLLDVNHYKKNNYFIELKNNSLILIVDDVNKYSKEYIYKKKDKISMKYLVD